MLIPTLIALFAAAAHAAPDCTTMTTPARGAIFFLESDSAPQDSTITVRLCLVVAPSAQLAGARLTIPYDTTLLRFAGSPTRRPVTITPARGSISVAAAATPRLTSGLVATLMFKRIPIPSIAVGVPQLIEATGVERGPIGGSVRVAGWSATAPATSPVQIDSIVPRTATIGNGELIKITIYGKGFTATDNALLMSGVRIGAIRSPDGRSASFVVPRSLPATSEVPPRLLEPGNYTLQIKNTAGASNIVTLTLRTP